MAAMLYSGASTWGLQWGEGTRCALGSAALSAHCTPGAGKPWDPSPTITEPFGGLTEPSSPSVPPTLSAAPHSRTAPVHTGGTRSCCGPCSVSPLSLPAGR